MGEKLILWFVPSLVATLLDREKAKGSPLTEEEVLEIRDKAPVIALPAEGIHELEAKRGYQDIDPEHCWEQWQQTRTDLNSEG